MPQEYENEELDLEASTLERLTKSKSRTKRLLRVSYDFPDLIRQEKLKGIIDEHNGDVIFHYLDDLKEAVRTEKLDDITKVCSCVNHYSV